MANFKLVSAYEKRQPLRTLSKASATVILPGDLVALDTGLAIKGTALTTAHAFCPTGAIAGETTVQVLDDRDAIFECTSEVNFAVAQRGLTYDIAASGDGQTLNQAASTLDVLEVVTSDDAGTVGSKLKVKVKISSFLD